MVCVVFVHHLKQTVKVSVNGRTVTVRGKKGNITRTFKVQIEIDIINATGGKFVRARMWHAKRRNLSKIRTIIAHISNMV